MYKQMSLKGFHYRNSKGQDLIEVICQYILFGSCVYADSSSTFAYSHTCKLDTQKLKASEYNFDV